MREIDCPFCYYRFCVMDGVKFGTCPNCAEDWYIHNDYGFEEVWWEAWDI